MFAIGISYLLFDRENIIGIIMGDILEVICATKGAVNFSNAWNLCPEIIAGLIIPKPPSLTGRAIRSLINLKHDGWPVRERMNI